MKELNYVVAKEGLFAEWWRVERQFWFFLNFWDSLPIILIKYLRQLYYKKGWFYVRDFEVPVHILWDHLWWICMEVSHAWVNEHLIEKIIQLMSKEQRNAKSSTKFCTEVTQTLPIFDTFIPIPVYYPEHQTFNPYPFKGHWRSNSSVGEWC